MNSARKETMIGGLVAGIGALFLISAYGSGGGNASTSGGYDLTARFNRTDGLNIGSDVRVAGIAVGKVVHQSLNESYRSVVTLHIRDDIVLPTDSAALIHSDGLLGTKYVELEPGGAEEMLKPHAQIRYTQDSIVVEDLLTRILAQAKAKHGKGNGVGDEGAIPKL